MFVWGERLITAALVVFIIVRLGPQLSALTGVGPDLGRAPQYEFTSLDGAHIASSQLAGKVVVVNFWATWCAPCRLEMPALQKLHAELEAQGVQVLGLATDVGNGDPIRSFIESREITYPVGRATPRHRAQFGGVNAIPTTFIIDREGLVRHRVVGFFAPPALRAAVRRLLQEPTPPEVDPQSLP